MIKYFNIAPIIEVLAALTVFSATASAESTLDEVGERLSGTLPGISVTSLTETPVPGLYELITDGQIYYLDESAEYLIDGSLIQLKDRVNLTDARLGGIHMSLISAMGEENMLIYEPAKPSTRSITVFTDISCGYCRRLHAEIDTLLEEGVRVRYLLFPRAGLGSQGHKDLESVWCADDPQGAMTNAKAGGKIDPKSCANPIEQHVALAEQLGLRGTPLIYTDSGEKIPGYREASALASMVNDSEPMAN
jgi:thiol:disulfide interchange protein DsbC